MEKPSNSTHEEISVSIRMRPMNEREMNAGQEKIFTCVDVANAIQQVSSKGEPVEGQTYYFDKVFDGNATTTEVYNDIAKDIVKGVVKGINGTIFAYGQTSSGKTHTMVGKLDSGGNQRGILEMAAIDILNLIAETSDRDFLVRVSFVEIYNENIRDLLSDAADSSVAIREDPRKGVYCEASEVIIADFESIMRALKRGINKRTVESTAMNDTSSRSRTIFKLVIESKQSVREGQDPDGAILVASLTLVDLAGSESVRHTNASGQRAKEGGKINQSLLSLSRVIQSLSQPGSHVNYRDSKLTRLLQPSLSGNAKMAIVCCITPADKYLEETRSTLQFASRAKLVTTHATVNEVLDDSVKLKRLQRELNALKEKQKSAGVSDEEFQRMESEKENLHSQLTALAEEKELQRIQLEHLKHLVVIGGADNDDVGVDVKRPKKRVRDTWCPGLSVGHKDSLDTDGFSRFKSSGSSKSIQASDALQNEPARPRLSEGSNGHDMEDDGDRTFVVDTEMLDQLEFANNTIQQLQEELAFLRACPSAETVNNVDYERLKSERDTAVEQLEIEMGANAESEASWRRLIDELKQENLALEEKLTQEQNKTSHLTESDEELISVRLQLDQAKTLFEEASSLSNSLRSQVETMQQQNDEVSKKVADLEEESANLRSQVASFEEEKLSLQASLDTLSKELEVVQANQAGSSVAEEELEAKVANQHEMLVFAKSTIEELTAQVAELETEVADKSTSITDLQTRISEKDAQIATDAETIRSLEEKIQGNEAIISEMERNMQEFFSIVNDSKAREEMIELKLSEEEEKTLELADQVLRLEKQFEGAVNDLTAEKLISAQLKKDVDNSIVVVQNYEQELSISNERLTNSADQVSSLESKVHDLSQQLVALKETASTVNGSELAKKDKQLQQLNSELGGKDGEISRLMHTLQEVQSRCETAEQELEKLRVREHQTSGDEESMKKRVGQLQTTVDLLKSEKDILTRKLSESESALETLYNESCAEKAKMTSHADGQAKQIEKLQVDLQNASQSIDAASALETKLASVRAEKESAEAEIKHLSQLVQDLENAAYDSANASVLRDDNDRLRATVSDIENAITEANQRFKKAKDEASMLKTELDHVESESNTARNALIATKTEKDNLMVELEKALSQVQALTEALVEAETMKPEVTESANAQVHELGEKIAKLEAEVLAKDRVIESFKEEIQELKDATMILPHMDSEEVDSLRQEKLEAEQKCETTLAECAELKNVVTKYSSMLQRGQEALQDAFDDNELLKTRSTELEEKLEEVNKKHKVAAEKERLLIEQCDSLSIELKEKERALQRLQCEAAKSKQASDQVLTSTEKVEVAEDCIAQLREERDTMSLEYTQMRDELRSLKQQYELAESALESARRELAEVIDTKDKRIAHLEKHKLTKEHLEMINKLKDERKKYQEDCKTMKRQLSDLKRAYETLRDSAATATEESKAQSRSSKAKAESAGEEKSKDAAGLESELIIAKGELDASHNLVLSLKNKLRDCSKQLQEYESERTGIIDVLERNGIDTAGLIYDSKSTSDNEADAGSASLLEADLVDAVSKLAEKLVAAKATIAQIEQKRATTVSSNNERLKELEDSLLHVQAELVETRAQRNVLEKRVETHKSAVRVSREEVASMTIELESVRQAMAAVQEELNDAKSKITNMRMTAPTASDAAAPEIQALEEENIELLKENKELRKSVATLKAQAEKAAKISEFSQPRQFGTDLGTRILSAENIVKSNSNDIGVTKPVDATEAQQKRVRNRKMSVAGGDENTPGECAQS